MLDASMSLAWLFEDVTSPDARAVLIRVAEHGAAVPPVWRLEVLNGLLVAFRRGRREADFMRYATGYLARLPITEDQTAGATIWTEVLDLAEAERLTAYDAAYLELALRLKLPLASGDKALIAAARRRGLEVLTP